MLHNISIITELVNSICRDSMDTQYTECTLNDAELQSIFLNVHLRHGFAVNLEASSANWKASSSKAENFLQVLGLYILKFPGQLCLQIFWNVYVLWSCVCFCCLHWKCGTVAEVISTYVSLLKTHTICHVMHIFADITIHHVSPSTRNTSQCNKNGEHC